MMANLRNHPGKWMRSDAEASLARWEADHGVIGVNSAGRTAAEQQALINRWDQGGTYNRPPYLYSPKRPATASSHVYDGGIAFDTSEWKRFIKTCADYGWYQRYSWDVVHFEYRPSHDKKKNQSAGGSTGKPATNPIAPVGEEDEEDMRIKFGHRTGEATDEWMIVHPQLAGGYRVTTSEKEAIAWSRLYGRGWDKNENARYDFNVNRADYIAIQNAAKKDASAWRAS